MGGPSVHRRVWARRRDGAVFTRRWRTPGRSREPAAAGEQHPGHPHQVLQQRAAELVARRQPLGLLLFHDLKTLTAGRCTP